MFGLSATTIARLVIGLLVLAVLGFIAHELYQAGYNASEIVWTKREAQITSDAAANLKAAQDAVKAEEARHNTAQQALITSYEKSLKEANDAKSAALASVAAGRTRLFIDAKCPVSGGAVPGVPASGQQSDGSTRAELSGPDAQFLVGLASEADAVAIQLQACQSLLKQDRQ